MASEGPDKDKKEDSKKSPWSYLNIGIQFGVTVGLFAALGSWLDGKYNWEPWGIISLSMFGVAAGMYHLIKGFN